MSVAYDNLKMMHIITTCNMICITHNNIMTMTFLNVLLCEKISVSQILHYEFQIILELFTGRGKKKTRFLFSTTKIICFL